jgi:hypothetical protein
MNEQAAQTTPPHTDEIFRQRLLQVANADYKSFAEQTIIPSGTDPERALVAFAVQRTEHALDLTRLINLLRYQFNQGDNSVALGQ